MFRIRIHLIRIRLQYFGLNTDPDLDPIQIQSFDDQKWEKIYSWNFFYQKLKTMVQFTYPETSKKDVQATEEALNPQKRTSCTSKI